MKFLIVVDMQNDFTTGSLGSNDAVRIIPAVAEKIRSFSGKVLFTRDTHTEAYLLTQEGKNLPVPHCIKGTPGWEICPELAALIRDDSVIFDKPAFGSLALAEYLRAADACGGVEEIELCGVCTDVCVISNAMLIKAALPEVPLSVDASCCAGTSRANHINALNAMQICQIKVYGEAEL